MSLRDWEQKTPEGRAASGCLMVVCGVGALVWAIVDPAFFFDSDGGVRSRAVFAVIVAPAVIVGGVYRVFRSPGD
jgi:hypothetical protein